jgi:tight adherence protein C
MTFIYSLILLSPIYAAGMYFLFKDDQAFISRKIKEERKRHRFEQKHFRIILIIGCSFMILITLLISGASLIIIVIPTTSICIYLYWEFGGAKRIVKKKDLQAEAEFPAMVELIAVLIAAGEPPISSIQRVAERSTGVLAHEFMQVIKNVENGIGLTKSLELLTSRTKSDSVRRFADTLILALERGTSLSDVLARQVQEVRNEFHAKLLESAGKAEISLMIPVIFLILPISILFALWPSYLALGQSVFA